MNRKLNPMTKVYLFPAASIRAASIRGETNSKVLQATIGS